MSNELRILFPTRIYPEVGGAYQRTFNMAKLAASEFQTTTMFATDEQIEHSEEREGIHIVQQQKFSNGLNKAFYILEGLFSRDWSLKTPERVFEGRDFLLQIESPYFYNALKKREIDSFILNQHNVFWELLEYPSSSLIEKAYRKLTFKRDKMIEINAIKNAVHIFACSERDKRIISTEVLDCKDKITVIPNCIDLDKYKRYESDSWMEKTQGRRYRIVFVGLLSYYPNRDAIDIILHKVAPQFDRDVEFLIIGKNPPPISTLENVTFTGYVPDVRQYIASSDICISPLRYGSGTRLKILEYMAMGKPVVSTSKGAEGIDYTHNKNIIIEDNISLFAERIRELIEDEERRRRIGKAGM